MIFRALSWLMARFTKGRGFVRDDRTRADLATELRDAGFADVTVTRLPHDAMNDYYVAKV